ncbi:MAG: pirin family protein [Promethearchaeota archaeon]
MNNGRKIKRIMKSKPTMEGAGVRLKRAFGHNEASLLDPFLLLDDFHSNNPNDYIAGFPWHPHRGIETITYMLYGEVEHEDSLGNKGVIHPGDVQWMTAGSGIIHQEMPQKQGLLWGFQLWANLPASHKMMDPRYRDVKKEQIPELILNNNIQVKVICGEVNGEKGPVQDIVTDPEYLDVSIPPKLEFRHYVKTGHTVFAYVIEGEGHFDQSQSQLISANNLVIFEDGNEVRISTDDKSVHFLLISGKPIGEPVAWYGPIVMNTRKELEVAFAEYRNGTFIKYKR